MAMLTFADLGTIYQLSNTDGIFITQATQQTADFQVSSSNGWCAPFYDADSVKTYNKTLMFLVF